MRSKQKRKIIKNYVKKEKSFACVSFNIFVLFFFYSKNKVLLVQAVGFCVLYAVVCLDFCPPELFKDCGVCV